MRMSRNLLMTAILSLALLAGVVPQGLALSIGGTVRQPLNLTAEDLLNTTQTEARLSDVTRDGRFKGVFLFRGVPLRNLLQMASVHKEVEGFSKPIDLAIVVTDRAGRRTVLSWGEIFYGRPSDIIIATSATPVMPGSPESCTKCHEASQYRSAMDQMDRTIGFPRLVIANDLYSDRCLENVAHIEVVDLKGKAEWEPGKKATSHAFVVKDASGRFSAIKSLSGHRPVTVSLKQVGSGRGYHGIKKYEGVPLRELLLKAGVSFDHDSAFLITAADGYRSLLSSGETFLGSRSERIIVFDNRKTPPVGDNRGFSLVLPDDFLSDRMVKTIRTVEIVSLKPNAKVYIIGVGCGDTSLITLEAISYMGKAGAFVGAKHFTDRFAKYMGGKPVLFDPFTSWAPVYKKKHPKLSDDEVRRITTGLRAKEIRRIWDMLKAGKSVAVLEPGDPTIYGGWENWLLPEFEGYIEVVTGINSVSAANAMIGKNIAADQRSIVLTTPWALKENKNTLKTVSETGDTMIVFMGLKDIKSLAVLLGKHYPATTPVTIAYKAGISHKKRLVKTTLANLPSTVAREGENFLGLIYVGAGVPTHNQK